MKKNYSAKFLRLGLALLLIISIIGELLSRPAKAMLQRMLQRFKERKV